MTLNMSNESKGFPRLIPISADSAGDLARKGWYHGKAPFINYANEDDSASYSGDELSISWNSSPGSPQLNKIDSRISREVATILNFDDCIVKTNNVLQATVERITKPMQGNSSPSSNSGIESIDITFTQNTNALTPSEPLCNGEGFAHETPNNDSYLCKRRFQALYDVANREVSDVSSLEIELKTPPKQFCVGNCSNVTIQSEEILSENNKNTHFSLAEVESTSPIIQSNRRKLMLRPNEKSISRKLSLTYEDSSKELTERLTDLNKKEENVIRKDQDDEILLSDHLSCFENIDLTAKIMQMGKLSPFNCPLSSQNAIPLEVPERAISPVLCSNVNRRIRHVKHKEGSRKNHNRNAPLSQKLNCFENDVPISESIEMDKQCCFDDSLSQNTTLLQTSTGMECATSPVLHSKVNSRVGRLVCLQDMSRESQNDEKLLSHQLSCFNDTNTVVKPITEDRESCINSPSSTQKITSPSNRCSSPLLRSNSKRCISVKKCMKKKRISVGKEKFEIQNNEKHILCCSKLETEQTCTTVIGHTSLTSHPLSKTINGDESLLHNESIPLENILPIISHLESPKQCGLPSARNDSVIESFYNEVINTVAKPVTEDKESCINSPSSSQKITPLSNECSSPLLRSNSKRCVSIKKFMKKKRKSVDKEKFEIQNNEKHILCCSKLETEQTCTTVIGNISLTSHPLSKTINCDESLPRNGSSTLENVLPNISHLESPEQCGLPSARNAASVIECFNNDVMNTVAKPVTEDKESCINSPSSSQKIPSLSNECSSPLLRSNSKRCVSIKKCMKKKRKSVDKEKVEIQNNEKHILCCSKLETEQTCTTVIGNTSLTSHQLSKTINCDESLRRNGSSTLENVLPSISNLESQEQCSLPSARNAASVECFNNEEINLFLDPLSNLISEQSKKSCKRKLILQHDEIMNFQLTDSPCASDVGTINTVSADQYNQNKSLCTANEDPEKQSSSAVSAPITEKDEHVQSELCSSDVIEKSFKQQTDSNILPSQDFLSVNQYIDVNSNSIHFDVICSQKVASENKLVFDTLSKELEYSSQSSNTDVIVCSQVFTTLRSKFNSIQNLIRETEKKEEINKDVFGPSNGNFTENIDAPLCSKGNDQKDLNSSKYIENASSDEDSNCSPERKKSYKIQAPSRTYPKLKKLNIYSSSHKKLTMPQNSRILLEEQNEISNNLQISPTVQVSVFHDLCKKSEGINTAQNQLPLAESEIPAISQAVSPSRKVISQGADVHISSGSSIDAEKGAKSPPRKTSPVVDKDSGKKRKRLKKDGLAARLQRLLAHKQASTHLCKYEVAAGIRRPGDSVFVVKKAWLEYHNTMVLCTTCPSVSNKNFDVGNISSGTDFIRNSSVEEETAIKSLWVIVLDSNTIPIGCLKENSSIRIYTPWQTMRVPRLGITLVLNVTNVELVLEKCQVLETDCSPSVQVDTFHCSCLDDDDIKLGNCNYKIPNHGKKLARLMFPVLLESANEYNHLPSLEAVTIPSNSQKGTIAEAVVCQNHALVNNIWVLITVHRIFCFRNSEFYTDNEDDFNSFNLIWSVLGEDVSGELCEIVLGSPKECAMTKEWAEITSGSALDRCFRFTGLNFIRKVNREINIYPQVSSSSAQQMLIHVFSTTSGIWNMESRKTTTVERVFPKLVTLSDVLIKDDSCCSRLNVLVKPLFRWNSILYISDNSVDFSKYDIVTSGYLSVHIEPLCYMPKNILSHIVYLQDLLFYEGKLYADKYCRVFDAENGSAVYPSFDPSDIQSLKNIFVQIPNFKTVSQIGDLVTIKGEIFGVDEQTALVWPVCQQCGQDLIEQRGHHQLLCKHCGLADSVSKISLAVLVKEITSSEKVKIELLQKTILSLLPDALESTDLQVASVLRKPIGPLVCVIIEKSPCSTKDFVHLLQEVPSW